MTALHQEARADVGAPQISAKAPMTANAVAVTPAAKPTAEPSGPRVSPARRAERRSSEAPTSIASAPHSVQRMARMPTWRSTDLSRGLAG